MNFIKTMQHIMKWPCIHGIRKVLSYFNANTAAYENNIHCHNVNTEQDLPETSHVQKSVVQVSTGLKHNWCETCMRRHHSVFIKYYPSRCARNINYTRGVHTIISPTQLTLLYIQRCDMFRRSRHHPQAFYCLWTNRVPQCSRKWDPIYESLSVCTGVKFGHSL
jgi:hypothetical protein